MGTIAENAGNDCGIIGNDCGKKIPQSFSGSKFRKRAFRNRSVSPWENGHVGEFLVNWENNFFSQVTHFFGTRQIGRHANWEPGKLGDIRANWENI